MTSDTLRRVTGTLKTPDGEFFSLRTLIWTRTRRTVTPQGASTIVDQPFRVQTDESGAIDDLVLPGSYTIMVSLSDSDRYFKVVVPDALGPFNIADLLDAEPVPPDVISAVQQLVIEARAWAVNPEDSEVEPGEFSAKHYALKAEAAADAALNLGFSGRVRRSHVGDGVQTDFDTGVALSAKSQVDIFWGQSGQFHLSADDWEIHPTDSRKVRLVEPLPSGVRAETYAQGLVGGVITDAAEISESGGGTVQQAIDSLRTSVDNVGPTETDLLTIYLNKRDSI